MSDSHAKNLGMAHALLIGAAGLNLPPVPHAQVAISNGAS
jgi:hypothetical protein